MKSRLYCLAGCEISFQNKIFCLFLHNRASFIHSTFNNTIMSSAEYSFKLFKPIVANRQTVWTLIRQLLKEQPDLDPQILKSQAVDKADDICCDWQFKG